LRGGEREHFRALVRALNELFDDQAAVLDEIEGELPALRQAPRGCTS